MGKVVKALRVTEKGVVKKAATIVVAADQDIIAAMALIVISFASPIK